MQQVAGLILELSVEFVQALERRGASCQADMAGQCRNVEIIPSGIAINQEKALKYAGSLQSLAVEGGARLAAISRWSRAAQSAADCAGRHQSCMT